MQTYTIKKVKLINVFFKLINDLNINIPLKYNKKTIARITKKKMHYALKENILINEIYLYCYNSMYECENFANKTPENNIMLYYKLLFLSVYYIYYKEDFDKNFTLFDNLTNCEYDIDNIIKHLDSISNEQLIKNINKINNYYYYFKNITAKIPEIKETCL